MDKGSGEECGRADPPGCEEETILWVSCDGCLLRWHITCLGFDMETRLSQNSNVMKSGAITKLSDAAICDTVVKFPLLPSRLIFCATSNYY